MQDYLLVKSNTLHWAMTYFSVKFSKTYTKSMSSYILTISFIKQELLFIYEIFETMTLFHNSMWHRKWSFCPSLMVWMPSAAWQETEWLPQQRLRSQRLILGHLLTKSWKGTICNQLNNLKLGITWDASKMLQQVTGYIYINRSWESLWISHVVCQSTSKSELQLCFLYASPGSSNFLYIYEAPVI